MELDTDHTYYKDLRYTTKTLVLVEESTTTSCTDRKTFSRATNNKAVHNICFTH